MTPLSPTQVRTKYEDRCSQRQPLGWSHGIRPQNRKEIRPDEEEENTVVISEVENIPQKKRSYAHLVYALISIACPFIALGIITVYQEYAYSGFWPPPGAPVDDADINAGALMGFFIVVQGILAVGVGSLFGLIFAALSLRKRRRILSFGTAALLFNLLPILGIAFIFVRGRL